MTKKNQKYGLVALGLLIGLMLAGCGDATSTTAPKGTASSTPTTAANTTTIATTIPGTASTAPTTAAVAATLPPGAKAVKAGPNSKESTLLKAVVPNITATLDALKKGDITGAKKAFADYSNAWNGIEVYVNSRSKQLYDTIEVQNEFKANDLFDKAGVKAEEIIPFVEGVQKGYNEALKLAETGPDYDAVLDEIADIRIVRIDLRKSIAALTAGDIAMGKTTFEKFDTGWDNIEGSIKPRSKELYVTTEKNIDAVSQLYKADKPVAADLLIAENTLLVTYNRSLTMLNTIRSTGKVPAKEVILLQGVSPNISATLTALKKPDIKAAKSAFDNYSYGWSGVEIYVKTRSAQAYSALEDYEGKIDKLFEAQTPNPAEIIPLVEGLQKGYTDATNVAIAGQSLNPILDEVADMRIVQTNLDKTIIALKANDLPTAKASFQQFSDGWTDVEDSVSSRSKDVYKDIEEKISTVERGLLRADKPVVGDVTTALTDLQSSYGNGLKLLTAALS